MVRSVKRLFMATATKVRSEGEDSRLAKMFEVGRELGIPWRWCRRLLEFGGVEVLTDGRKAWVVRRADWLRVRDALRGRV